MDDHDADEVPRYFICPISLQIMKDPVITTTGITYDRDSIERWLFVNRRTTCPVTNETLPAEAELTPNHTLRRLIQCWSALHTDRIPTPRPPADLPTIQRLLQELSGPSLCLLSSIAAESESNRRLIIRAGASHRLLCFLTKASPASADSALSLLLSLRLPPEDLRPLISDNHDLIESLTALISSPEHRPNAILFLKTSFDLASPKLLERLKAEFFHAVAGIIRAAISNQSTKAALQVLLKSSPWGTNRTKIVAAGAAAAIIEMELRGDRDRRMTELGLAALEQMCMCADGRAALAGHPAGIAMVAKRMIRVSPAADEKAVGILTVLSKYSATAEVVQEMLAVGAASKLCLVMQADCLSGVREKARFVLRLHSRVWKNSPCINLNQCFLSRYP
ncbi:E3 ubiquitin-protein ligase PUB23 [Platanthera zijinensis]|uniref:U-box domain-containing protein n=1 Tax=Platanthera zijinensis TaxID=2320716 RepID=A0AAP0BU58_9ASPA